MAMIFPGMDPYLENPASWPNLHNRLIVYIADQIGPLLKPRYRATINERVFVELPTRRTILPDVYVKQVKSRSQRSPASTLAPDAPEMIKASSLRVREPFLEIVDSDRGKRVVTIVELLSPTNKTVSSGRKSYRKKQSEVLRSEAHLVEIDLLRTGRHTVACPEPLARDMGPYHYLVSVNRAIGDREDFEIYRRCLPQRLPRIALPLGERDRDVVLDLQAAVDHLYEQGGFRDDINYRRPCRPPLTAKEQAWADELLRAAGVK